MEQKPSIGRIVVYNHPGSADGKFPPKQSPALIQKVNEDGTVEIVVFLFTVGYFSTTTWSRETAPASGIGRRESKHSPKIEKPLKRGFSLGRNFLRTSLCSPSALSGFFAFHPASLDG
jgi:hypothetical protein